MNVENELVKASKSTLKLSIVGASLFSWPLLLMLLVVLLAPTAGDIFLILALPVLASFFAGAIIALLAGIRGVALQTKIRKSQDEIEPATRKRAIIATVVGLSPAALGALFLYSLYGPHVR